jgi:hypothetical protein
MVSPKLIGGPKPLAPTLATGARRPPQQGKSFKEDRFSACNKSVAIAATPFSPAMPSAPTAAHRSAVLGAAPTTPLSAQVRPQAPATASLPMARLQRQTPTVPSTAARQAAPMAPSRQIPMAPNQQVPMEPNQQISLAFPRFPSLPQLPKSPEAVEDYFLVSSESLPLSSSSS